MSDQFPQSVQATHPIATPISALTHDFLTWLAARPRTYAEAMEAWRTSCPRFPIWEDALSDGLFRLEREAGVSMDHTRVALTARGRTMLDRA